MARLYRFRRKKKKTIRGCGCRLRRRVRVSGKRKLQIRECNCCISSSLAMRNVTQRPQANGFFKFYFVHGMSRVIRRAVNRHQVFERILIARNDWLLLLLQQSIGASATCIDPVSKYSNVIDFQQSTALRLPVLLSPNEMTFNCLQSSDCNWTESIAKTRQLLQMNTKLN